MGVFFKMTGALCVMGAAGYFACSVNQTRELRKKELRKLYSILLQLKSEIQYMNHSLPDCFERLANGTGEPFQTWFMGMLHLLENKENILFADVWMEGTKTLLTHSALETEDVEPLYDLADKLGTSDISAQLKAIDYALIHLERNRTALEMDLEQKKKVTLTLSLFCGAMTLIILL